MEEKKERKKAGRPREISGTPFVFSIRINEEEKIKVKEFLKELRSKKNV